MSEHALSAVASLSTGKTGEACTAATLMPLLPPLGAGLTLGPEASTASDECQYSWEERSSDTGQIRWRQLGFLLE